MAVNPTYGAIALRNRPRSVEEITKEAQDYDYNALIPVKRWLRAATNILRQADVYDREGNDEQTYLLLFRHAHLVLTNITVHPEARKEGNRAAVEEAEKEVQRNLKRLEILRPRLKKRYERYQEIQREREARRAATNAAAASDRRPSTPQHLDDHVHALDPRDHGELAVRLAQKEARRRARDAGQYGQGGDSGSWERGGSYQSSDEVKDDLSRRLQEVRARVERPSAHYQQDQSSSGIRTPSYNYPSVPTKSALSKPWEPTVTPPMERAYGIPPSLPPKESFQRDTGGNIPPNVPSKDPLRSPSPPPKTTATPPPSYTFKTTATTESGAPLRTLFLPPTLRHTFLDIARPNTGRNLETCGILAGSLVSNALIISHLIIPSQNSTTDTCEMEDEGALFDYVDNEDLMVFGWIHTHPTQTCFMSSRDLHTQSGYQVMLPESIAIVCAPSQHTQHDGYDGDGDWGCFRLTDPPGLKSILSCRKEGLFHPHDIQDIYTGALRPGHVVEANGLEFKVMDLRGK